MKYYILNIIEEKDSKRVNTVDKWMDLSFAPIFFYEITVEEILEKRKPTDAFLFCNRSQDLSWSHSKIVGIGNNDIYIYNPIEKVKNYSTEF